MERDFKGIWIPKDIWLSEELTLQEKVFLVEIDSLDNEQGCYAGNEYFSKFFGLSKTRVSIVINSLVKKKYITSTIIYKEGTKQILKRVLKVCYRGYIRNVKDPMQEKFIESNTINNTINNTLENKERNSVTPALQEVTKSYTEIDIDKELELKKEIKIDYTSIKDLWNSKNLPKIKVLSVKRKDKIKSRIKEVGEEEFVNAINKISESSFCTGNNKRNWKADIDWLLENDNNIVKVLEGRYDDKVKTKSTEERTFTKTKEQIELEELLG